MRKIVKKRQLFNKRLVLNIILVLFMFLSIGYSTLSTNLNINGNLNVKKYVEPTLYNVLKEEAETGGLARKYTGNHHDSFTEEPSKDIYHWYAATDTQGAQILDKNNVIFAGQCFQMIRTTDTGGVKMIYNGEAENNQCLNTRGTHVGYASRTSTSLASQYWYGTDYIYDSTAKKFKVSGTTEQTTWNAATGLALIGKYTCKSASVDGTCSTLYLVESYYNTTSAYVIPLNSNSHYSQFGTLQFNGSNSSPSYVGYMYNTVYPYNYITLSSSETMFNSSSINSNYIFADEAIWGDPSSDYYNLMNPKRVSQIGGYSLLKNKYTFGGNSYFTNQASNYSYGEKVNYIAAVNNSTYYYIQLGNEAGSTHDLSYYNYIYTYGDSYTVNGDGTYTINNPATVERKDWYTNYNNVKNKYVCKNAENNTCSELWYTIESEDYYMTYMKVGNNIKYSKGFSWDGSKYVLDNYTAVTFWNITDTINRTSINNAHYTCWNESGECTAISYIYYILNKKSPYYINLTNGKSVEDAINEMLYDDNVNTINSIIKSGVDAWYKQYLSDYSDYLEETIFCNNRTQTNYLTNGWNPNGGMINTYIEFEYSEASDLSCTNITDQYSVSNNKAKLTYNVGLISYAEMCLIKSTKARKTGQTYWIYSPSSFSNSDAGGHYVYKDGYIDRVAIRGSYGVRPAVSLRPGTRYSDGDGSMANPYVVDTSGN